MANKNQKQSNVILNYFVLYDTYGKTKSPEIWSFPFYIDSGSFIAQLNKQNKAKNIPEFKGDILHVCYDVANQKMYLPDFNLQDIKNNQELINYVQYKLDKLHKTTSPAYNYMPGNPYNLFRIRKVGDFRSASDFIKTHLARKNILYNADLPVVEADLSKMPHTVQKLQATNDIISIYVDSRRFSIIPFVYSENNRSDLLYTMKSPFILININPTIHVSELEKDRMVIEGYKYYCSEQIPNEKENIDIFNIQYLLASGWTIEQLSTHLITPTTTKTISDLLDIGSTVMRAVYGLQKGGYYNALNYCFYYIVKRTPQFPIKITHNLDTTYNTSDQHIAIQMIHYDYLNDYVVLRSFLFISPEVSQNIFHTTDVDILKYDPYENKLLLQKDFTNEAKKSYREAFKNAKLEISKDNQTLNLDIISNNTKSLFSRRKIEDFHLAANEIKQMCRNSGIQFANLDVTVGPFSSVIQGLKGGFYDEERAKKMGVKIPWEFLPGFIIPSNSIMVDTESHKSIADMSDVLIHEYQHYINKLLKVESPVYRLDASNIEAMSEYLDSPDEQGSHIQQAVHLLSSGMSRDQIIYRFLGHQYPTSHTLPLAKKYNKFIDEAQKIIEKAQSEEKIT